VVRLIVLLAVAVPFGVGLASLGITLLGSKSYDFPRVEIEATCVPTGRSI
jgi:hypothetical protein